MLSLWTSGGGSNGAKPSGDGGTWVPAAVCLVCLVGRQRLWTLNPE